jgi:hypothetical protein
VTYGCDRGHLIKIGETNAKQQQIALGSPGRADTLPFQVTPLWCAWATAAMRLALLLQERLPAVWGHLYDLAVVGPDAPSRAWSRVRAARAASSLGGTDDKFNVTRLGDAVVVVEVGGAATASGGDRARGLRATPSAGGLRGVVMAAGLGGTGAPVRRLRPWVEQFDHGLAAPGTAEGNRALADDALTAAAGDALLAGRRLFVVHTYLGKSPATYGYRVQQKSSSRQP